MDFHINYDLEHRLEGRSSCKKAIGDHIFLFGHSSNTFLMLTLGAFRPSFLLSPFV